MGADRRHGDDSHKLGVAEPTDRLPARALALEDFGAGEGGTEVTASNTTYAFDNAWTDAHRRLSMLEACYDPGTKRRLDAIGVGSGWRCLEVGGGAGSVARWLCDRVGPSGEVVAVDLDPRFLAQIDAANLSVHRLDVTRDALPAGPFDLVHARHLLMHLPERREVLGRLVRCLAPGGWLLLEEGDAFPTAGLAAEVDARLWGWYRDALARAGADTGWARHLPRLLDAVGLVDVVAEADVPLYRGGSATAEMVRLSFIQVAERDSPSGDIRVAVEEFCASLTDPRRWFVYYAAVAVSGRAPE
jgi:SAM-dependent methyltransferase